MNKAELVVSISEGAGITKQAAEQALEAMLQIIEQALVAGDEVRLIGFGTFCSSEKKAMMARNPQTGENIELPAHKVAKFKPGKKLKEAVAGK